MRIAQRMRRLCTAAVVLAACWGAANVYEAVVLVPLLTGLPSGSLPAELEVGSPVLVTVPVVLWIINPVLRDPVATSEDVAVAAWVWEGANFVRVLCAAAVVGAFWRLRDAQRG